MAVPLSPGASSPASSLGGGTTFTASCADALRTLLSGDIGGAISTLRDGLSTHQVSSTDAFSALRYAQCVHTLHASTYSRWSSEGRFTPLSAKDIIENSNINFTNETEFAKTWQALVQRRCSLTAMTREKRQWDLSIQLAKARREHGNGKELELASQEAEQGDAMKRLKNLEMCILRCVGGQDKVRKNVADPTKRDRILQEKEADLVSLRTERDAFVEADPAYLKDAASIADFNTYLQSSGVGDLLKQRDDLHNCHPSAEPLPAKFSREFLKRMKSIGTAFEAEALEVVKLREQRRAQEEETRTGRKAKEYHILQGVSLKVAFPTRTSGEIDMLVVECDPIAPPPDTEKDDKKEYPKYRVTRVVDWYEVKVNTDDLMGSLTGHIRAQQFLSTLNKDLLCAYNKGYVFHTSLFAGLGECPVTFIALAGPGSTVRGSVVPSNVLSPSNVMIQFVQYALDEHAPLEDDLTLATDFSYVPELYRRLGEFLLSPAHFRDDAATYAAAADRKGAAFLSEVDNVLRTAEAGKILILPDPFLPLYAERCRGKA